MPRSASRRGCRGCLGDGFVAVSRPVQPGALYLVWFGATRAYTGGTSTVTVNVERVSGVVVYLSLARHPCNGRGAVAVPPGPVPAGGPPGMDGVYGWGRRISGNCRRPSAVVADRLCDIAVLRVGTNDIEGRVTPAQYGLRSGNV